MDDMNGTLLIIEIIRELTGDTKHPNFVGTVSAEVKGSTVISEQDIGVALTYDGTNYAYIDVHWEDYGYKPYREMGLYGRMNTQFPSVIRTASREFRIIDNTYSVTIAYPSSEI
jgi:hypothetical protein